jgi:hypothetical protein
MSKTVPTVGDKVLYHTTQEDRDKIQPHGNSSPVLPAVVVAGWGSDTVNLKVICDADCPDLWVTSAEHGTQERMWEWQGHYEYRVVDQ